MSSLFLFTDHHHYFLYEAPTDMRKSFAGLEGIVKKMLNREMNEQDMYVFLNRQLTHIKILGYSKRKFSLIYEKLHKGTFKTPYTSDKKGTIQLSANELLMIIRGIHLNNGKK
jgi:transposase